MVYDPVLKFKFSKYGKPLYLIKRMWGDKRMKNYYDKRSIR